MLNNLNIKILSIVSFIFLGIFATNIHAKEVITSAVGYGLKNGLHAKYLRYIANKLEAELSLKEMPFTRRVIETKKGKLDILVGIHHTKNTANGLHFIYPYYESMPYVFFTLKENKQSFNNLKSMVGKRIAVSRHATHAPEFDENVEHTKVLTSNLKQKIEMLQHGRVYGFTHYKEVTKHTLKRMSLDKTIVIADYQPNFSHKYHIAVSKKSQWLTKVKKISQIVKEGIRDGDFKKIRKDHYTNRG